MTIVTDDKIEWTHKEGETYYRITAEPLQGDPIQLSALIQVRGEMGDYTYLPFELGSHILRMLNLLMERYKDERRHEESEKHSGVNPE